MMDRMRLIVRFLNDHPSFFVLGKNLGSLLNCLFESSRLSLECQYRFNPQICPVGQSHSPGHCEYIDLFGPSLEQNSGTFIYRGTCCKNVIDEEDTFFGWISCQGKNSFHVLLPLGSCEFNLWDRIADSLQDPIIHEHTIPAGYLAGQKKGLVVTPLPQTIPMKGNRHKSVVLIHPEWQGIPFHQTDQGLSQICFVLILKSVNGCFNGSRKSTKSSSRGVGLCLCQTTSADVAFVGLRSKRNATFDAKWRADESDSGKA